MDGRRLQRQEPGQPLRPHELQGGAPLADGEWAKRKKEDREKEAQYLTGLYNMVLANANDGRFEHMVVSWCEGRTLHVHEVSRTLVHDSLWSCGAFIFAFLFILFQVRNVLLAFPDASGSSLALPPRIASSTRSSASAT